ncbi:MAG: ATP-binding protein, partial [Verrucomicrobiia bacterium]
VNYLEKCALDFLGSAGLRCRLEIPDNLPDRSLNSEVRHNLFLALKEALNNVVKHAHATEVRVGITMYDSVIELVVKDDGCGFGAGSSDRVAAGNGLHNMRQRLEKIGGQCEIAAEPGRGTTVHFKVSLGSPSS